MITRLSCSSDEDAEECPPDCYKPFQLVLARKYKFQLWPAIILGPSKVLYGFEVYFFRSKDVFELPRENILMFFENLIEKPVSFRRNGGFRRGILKHIHMDKATILPQFFIETRKGVPYTVTFFDLYLSTKQANYVLPESVSQTSLLSYEI